MQNFLVTTFNINMIYRNHVENKNALTAVLSLASWRSQNVDQKMRRPLIQHETGFTH